MPPERLAATLNLDAPVSTVRLVSPARAGSFAKLAIRSVRDLVTHFPRRYLDMSAVEMVASARINEMVTVKGHIHEIVLKRPKPRLTLVEIALTDPSGVLMVTCFRQPWLMDRLRQGMHLAVSGRLEFGYGFKRMTNPFIEVLGEDTESGEGIIVPIHPATEKVSTAWMRRLIGNALDALRGTLDPLPLSLRTRYRLPSRASALRSIHFPQTMEEVAMARRRFVYEEVLFLELHLMMGAAQRSRGREPVCHVIDGAHLCALRAALPFRLTGEQKAACGELLAVMGQERVANHMLLGDVGTGKTVVAAFGLAAAADGGMQAAMMAPTEVLARQYAEKLGPLLDEAGVAYETLTGSVPASQREAVCAKLAAGTVDVVFGTHALLEKDVVFRRLGLAVIDEQQRFGVSQRAALLAKGSAPDALYLTATPIPRTLALALYGSLSLSYLHHRPLNSAGNTTKVYTKGERGHAYDAARAALARGGQVYVVCPLIDRPKTAEDTGAQEGAPGTPGHDEYAYASVDIEDEADIGRGGKAAAVALAESLQAKTFIDYRVDLLHGQMAPAQKAEAMDRFRAGESQVLVATTVIEVGVDVAQATVMIIEDAERFGLSQLHQLRGRVGRGTAPGEVYLISGSKAPAALERLAAMERTEDGFELAAFDLSLRREGDILGNRQHGASALKLVNVVRDGAIIECAHADAKAILADDPELSGPGHRALAREVRMVFKDAPPSEGA